jgi:hypothetical protein
MLENKDGYKKAFGTTPLNSNTLAEMIKTNESGETSMYQPLMRNSMFGSGASIAKTGVNEMGKNLNNSNFRTALSSMMTSKFEELYPPNFTIELTAPKGITSKPKAPAPAPNRPPKNTTTSGQKEKTAEPKPTQPDPKAAAAVEFAEMAQDFINNFDAKGNKKFTKKSALSLLTDIEASLRDPAAINLIKSIKAKLQEKDISVYTMPNNPAGKSAYNNFNALFNRKEGTSNQKVRFGAYTRGFIMFVVDPATQNQESERESSMRLLLHEITHALTKEAITNPKTEADQLLVERLTELFKQFREANPGKSIPDLLTKTRWTKEKLDSNEVVLAEFAAHIFNDQTVIDSLQNTKLGDASLFDSILNIIKEWLGIPSDVSLYDALAYSLDDFINYTAPVEQPIDPQAITPNSEIEKRRAEINNIKDPQQRVAAEIDFIMSNLFAGVGEASANKIKEYADRILSGKQTREQVIQGLPKSFIEGIDALLEANNQTQEEPNNPVAPQEPKPSTYPTLEVGGSIVDLTTGTTYQVAKIKGDPTKGDSVVTMAVWDDEAGELIRLEMTVSEINKKLADQSFDYSQENALESIDSAEDNSLSGGLKSLFYFIDQKGFKALNAKSPQVTTFVSQFFPDLEAGTPEFTATVNIIAGTKQILKEGLDSGDFTPLRRFIDTATQIKGRVRSFESKDLLPSYIDKSVESFVNQFWHNALDVEKRVSIANKLKADLKVRSVDDALIKSILSQAMVNKIIATAKNEKFDIDELFKDKSFENLKSLKTLLINSTSPQSSLFGLYDLFNTPMNKGDQRVSAIISKEIDNEQKRIDSVIEDDSNNKFGGFSSTASFTYARSFLTSILANNHQRTFMTLEEIAEDTGSKAPILTPTELRYSLLQKVKEERIRIEQEITQVEKLIEEMQAIKKPTPEEVRDLLKMNAKLGRLRTQRAATLQLSKRPREGKTSLLDSVLRSIYSRKLQASIFEDEESMLSISLEDDDNTSVTDSDAIRGETQDNDSKNMELSLVASVKEHLNFIPDSAHKNSSKYHPNKYYSPKKAFVSLAQTVIDYIDFGALAGNDLSKWKAMVTTVVNQGGLTEIENDFLDQLNRIVITAYENKFIYRTREGKVSSHFMDPSHRIFINHLSEEVVNLHFAVDTRPEQVKKDFPLERMSLEEARKHPQIEMYSQNTLGQLLATVVPNYEWNTHFNSMDYFNALYRREKSRKLFTEIANVFSSLVEKNYMMGVWKNVRGGFMDVNYFEAKGAGLAKSVGSTIRRGILSLAEVNFNSYQEIATMEDESKSKEKSKSKKKNVNNRLAEALRNAGVDKLITDFKAESPETKALAFEKMLNLFGLNKIVGYRTFKVGGKSALWDNAAGLLTDLLEVSPEDTIEQINDLLSNQRGRLSSITKAVKSNTELDRNTSVTVGGNKKIYKLVPGSFFYDVAYQFTRTSEGKSVQEGSFIGGGTRIAGTPGLAAATGPVSQLKTFIPPFLTKTEHFYHNIFVGKVGEQSLQKIYSFQEHDSQSNFYGSRAISFDNESAKNWYTRKFSMGFLDAINGGSISTYHHFIFQPADRPRIPSLEVRILNSAEAEQAVIKALDQLKSRNHDYFKSINKSYQKEKFFQFGVAKTVIRQIEENSKLTDLEVYEIFDAK